LLSFLIVVPDLFFLTVLRLVTLFFLGARFITDLSVTVVDDLRVVTLGFSGGRFTTDLFVTVVDDLRVVTLGFSGGRFTTDLFVTAPDDLLVVPVFLPTDGSVADLFVIVVVDLRVVLALFPLDCPTFFDCGSDLLTELFPDELSEDRLYSSGCILANLFSPSFLWSGCEYVALYVPTSILRLTSGEKERLPL